MMLYIPVKELSVTTTASEVVQSDFWRVLPVVNCDKVADIPCDYPGAIGVPITLLTKLSTEQFEVVDFLLSPQIQQKKLYKRLIIRHLNPLLPARVDLTSWLKRTEAKFEIAGLVFIRKEDM